VNVSVDDGQKRRGRRRILIGNAAMNRGARYLDDISKTTS
jgi:hypothetical protein